VFEEGKRYTRAEIHSQVGGGIQEYLSTIEGRVVGGCLLALRPVQRIFSE
jgi:predicted oxidoreductase